MSLEMTERIAGPFLKSFICSGSAARQKRLISVLTFGNENGGVVKGIEFSGSVARWFTSRVDWRNAEPLERCFFKLNDEPPGYSIDTF